METEVPNLLTVRPATATTEPPRPVVVVNFDMPFVDMVGFMVRWTIAAIPALIILFGIFTLAWVLGLSSCAAFSKSDRDEPVPAWLKKR